MEDLLLKVFSEYGLPTAMLLIMIWLFVKFTNSHREERKEWREDFIKRDDRADLRQKETNEVIRSMTDVIREINRK